MQHWCKGRLFEDHQCEQDDVGRRAGFAEALRGESLQNEARLVMFTLELEFIVGDPLHS